MLRVVLAETEERQELVEQQERLAQLTTVPTETQVTMVIMERQELAVPQEMQEILGLLAILALLVAAGHEVTEELLEAEVMGEAEHPPSLAMALLVILVAQMETEAVLETGVLEATLIQY